MLLPETLYRRHTRRLRRRRHRYAAIAAIVVVAAAGLTVGVKTERITIPSLPQIALPEVDGEALLELGAPAGEWIESMLSKRDNTADGQAGEIPLAHGQYPGAPSADDNEADLGDPTRALEAVIVRYEQAADDHDESAESCEALKAAYFRVESALEAHNAATRSSMSAALESGRLETAVEEVRRDYWATGCSDPE